MSAIQFKVVNYPFEYPFGIAKGVKSSQEALQLCYTLEGFSGYGETTSIHYYQADVKKYADLISSKMQQICALHWSHPSEFNSQISEIFPQKPFLLSALDMAAWDIFAQKQQKPLYQVLGYEWPNEVLLSDYTIGVGNVTSIASKIKKHPYQIYKIKLDGKDDDKVLQILGSYPNLTLRIDANESWDLKHAYSILPILEKMNIDAIEQPFERSNVSDLIKFRQQTSIPIIADEAFQGLESLEFCAENYDGINIKLSKCAGVTAAIEIINSAQKKSLKVMLGSMSDGVIGSSALIHLAPKAHFLDIDGPLLFKDLYAKGVKYGKYGEISKPIAAGLGVSWV